MIIYKTTEQVEKMRQSALLVSKTLSEVAMLLKPGITTLSIDKMIGAFVHDHNAIPSFLNYRGYPFNSCISLNDVVVHGFPNNNLLKEGDIIEVKYVGDDPKTKKIKLSRKVLLPKPEGVTEKKEA